MRSEINVTPLIDVMLVLMILFMIVTPLAQSGLDVSLPETVEEESVAVAPPETLVLDIDEEGAVTINRQPIARDELPMRIRDIIETRADKTMFLRAHERLRYAEVVSILDLVRGNGVDRVGIVPPAD